MPASAEVVQVSEQIEHLSFDDPAQLAHLLRQLAD
jgi:hypothetical protein